MPDNESYGMPDDPSADDLGRRAENQIEIDFDAFSQVVRIMKRLDASARTRLFRNLISFFSYRGTTGGASSEAYPSHYPQTPGGSNVSPSAPFSEDRTPTPKDFLREKVPKTDVERIACLAYYLTHYRDTPHFKTIDLSKLNTEAAQIKLSNPAKAVENATRAGLLVQAVKGAKQLSTYGETYVQALPDRDAARQSIAQARPRRKKARSRTQSSGSSNDTDE
jgi:hypothetical protein